MTTSLTPQERALAAIYDQIPGIVFYIRVEEDGQFRLLSVTPTGLETAGLTRQQIEGLPLQDVIPPAARRT